MDCTSVALMVAEMVGQMVGGKVDVTVVSRADVRVAAKVVVLVD